MRSYDTATAAQLAGGTDISAHVLIWVTAKDRSTGAAQPIGFWTGDDDQTFVIGGQARLYHGAGAVLQVPVMLYQVGLSVRMHTLRLSSLAPEVVAAIRQYDARFAPCEIHRALFEPGTNALVAEPHRVFRGWVDAVKIATPAKGGRADCSVTLASAARALTRGLPIMRSDATQQLRSGDRFRRFIDLSGTIDVAWGEAGTST
jgi:hypothetical protein